MDDKKAKAAPPAPAKKPAATDTPKAAPQTKTTAKKADALKAKVERYTRLYPWNPCLHITSDGQVFLDRDKNLAQMHQSTLKGGEVKEFKTNAKTE